MTPQMQLTLSKVFEEKEIRAMDLNGELWVPVVDLADAWGVDRSTLTKIINRNPDIFKKLSTVIDFTSPKEILPNPQTVNNSLRLVNEQGIIVLGLKVSSSQIKNPKAKEKIVEFTMWVPELIRDLKKGLVQLTPVIQPVPMSHVQSPVEVLREQFSVAKLIVEETGIPKEQAQSYALMLAGERAGIDLHCYASALKAKSSQLTLAEAIPADQADFDSHFSLLDIAKFLKMAENPTRNLLESKNIIRREHGVWRVVNEKYGKNFEVSIGYPYRNIRKIWMRFNPELLKYLRLEGFDIQATKVSEV